MYKSRFNQWGIFKNNRECEAIPILRKRLQNPETPVSIELRGRPIEVQRLENYAKRRKLTANDIVRSRAVTPPEVQLQTLNEHTYMIDSASLTAATVSDALLVRRTSIQPCLQSPNTPGVPELVFAEIHHYMTVNLEDGIWVPGDDERSYNNRKTQYLRSGLNEFMDNIYIACSLFKEHKTIQAGRFLRKAFTKVEDIVRCERPNTLQFVLHTILEILRHGYLDIMDLLCRHFRDVAAHMYMMNHPLNRIFHKIYEQFSLQTVEHGGFVIFLLRNISDVWEAILGRYHCQSLVVKMDCVLSMLHLDASTSLDGLLYGLVQEYDQELGPQSIQSLELLTAAAGVHLQKGRFVHCEVNGQKLIERLAAARSPDLDLQATGHFLVGVAQARQDKYKQAEVNLRKAFELFEGLRERPYEVRGCRLQLINCLNKQGRFEEADALYAEIESYYNSESLRQFDEGLS